MACTVSTNVNKPYCNSPFAFLNDSHPLDLFYTKVTNGERLFKVSEFLTAHQVASFFSRMAAKIKQQTTPGEALSDSDVLAIEDEKNFSRAKESVMTALHVQHPISYDQYDVCCVVKDKSLSKLKLGVLKLLCENLNISMPADQRRKAPYILLLEDLVKTCSCSSG